MARELPIFPLPIVLFPGAPQPLHIFEPRYRQLLQDCLAADRRFGIAYVAPDPAPDADPVPAAGEVGCVALIRSNQALPALRSTSARLRQLATVLGPVAADAERRAAVRRGARGNGRGGRHPEIERAT